MDPFTVSQLSTAVVTIAVLWFMPTLNHATPFGIDTPTAQINHPTIVSALRKYRIGLIGVGLAWIAAALLTPGGQLRTLTLQSLPILVLIGAVIACHQLSKPVKRAKRDESWYDNLETGVVVGVSAPDQSASKHPWVVWILSLLPIIFAVGHACYHYPAMPDVIPTHYGNDGPDAWETKSVASVFLPIFIATGMTVMMFALSFISPTKGPVSPKGSPAIGLYLQAASVRAQRMVLAVSALACNVLICGLMVDTVPDGDLNDSAFAVLMTLFGLAIAGCILWAMRVTSHIPPEIAATAGELENPDEDHLWKLGIFYVNKEDPRMFVEKRQGFGQTVNFARWEVWLLAAVVFLPQPFILYFASGS